MRVEPEYASPRKRLVEQLAEKGIRDRRVLDAVERVPRHLFVKGHLRGQAYVDYALPLESGQTISQPWVVARMTELLDVHEDHRVLEVGTGSGYQTAVLALLAKFVFSLERIPELARQAIARMRDLEIDNVKIQAFDGTVGWSEMAPFHRIIVTAAAPEVPEPLVEQLAAGGRLLLPEGSRGRQTLVVYSKSGEGSLRRKEHEAVAFVPLIGRHGWRGS